MAHDVSPPLWMVTWDGRPFKWGFQTRESAEAFAERWQGQHGGISGGKGLLKHKDRRDYIEVRRDYRSEREYNERYDTMVRGNPQRIIVEHEAGDYGGFA